MSEDQRRDATRPGEREAALPERNDAHLVLIGVTRTPFATSSDGPRKGRPYGPICRI